MRVRSALAQVDEYFRNSGVVFVIGFLLLFTAIAAFDSHPQSKEFWKGFFKELAFAFLIGGIIAFSIERASKLAQHREMFEQLNLIKTNVFVAIYGPRANDAFFYHFKRQTLDRAYLRKNCVVHAQLRYLTDDQGPQSIMLLRIASHSTIVNESGKQSEFQASMMVEKPWDSAYDNYVEARALVNGSVLNTVDISGDFLCSSLAMTFAPFEEKRLTTEFQTIKYGRDQSSFQTLTPADRMDITISFPEDLDLYAQSRNAGELKVLSAASRSGIVLATIEEPIFPGGGFEFWWNASRPKAAAPVD
jgi:hypothetical protein